MTSDGSIASTPLCIVQIELAKAAPVVIGQTPWRNRRHSAIVGGSLTGERLNGTVLPEGGDWSELGIEPDGSAVTLLDVNSVWKTHDGALIHVRYSGRLHIPAAILPQFRDPNQIGDLTTDQYYFRIQPTFETADPRYGWLNRLVAIGFGRRTATGVTYEVHTID